MHELHVFDKYLKLQEINKDNNLGNIFNPDTAVSLYDVDFMDLVINEDYEVYPTAIISNKQIKPTLEMRFTNKGIYKLLALNVAMQKEVEKLWNEPIREGLL